MKNLLLSCCMIFLLLSCSKTSQRQEVKENTNANPVENMNVKDKSFEELFTQVDSADIRGILARLMVQEDHTVITAGTDSLFNSMPASWEVLSRYFEKPTTFSLLGANRYTLEFIRKQQTYTMSFFPKQYNGEVFALGRKSGRNSDKMKETKLTHAQTPSGNITYKEATVVIECQLFEITTVHPDDFLTKESRKFVEDGLVEGNDYHKLVFGTITNVWVRKGENTTESKQHTASSIILDASSGATSLTASATGMYTNQEKSRPSKSYPLIAISLGTLLAYAFTLLLQKRKHITKLTHRKIWNFILLISFLVAGLLGLFLIFQINYRFGFPIYATINTLHVDFGIVMAIVSIFHCVWHLNYYKKLFAKDKVAKSM